MGLNAATVQKGGCGNNKATLRQSFLLLTQEIVFDNRLDMG
jgi:hypothetical protein